MVRVTRLITLNFSLKKKRCFITIAAFTRVILEKTSFYFTYIEQEYSVISMFVIMRI